MAVNARLDYDRAKQRGTVTDNGPALGARGIVKRFGGVTALRGVGMSLNRGEIVALVGDNGAGKSTLVKILCGVHPADEGEVIVHGKPVHIESPNHALQLGISTVFQDLALVNARDVANNMFLGQEPMRYVFFVDRPRMVREAREAIEALRVGYQRINSLAIYCIKAKAAQFLRNK